MFDKSFAAFVSRFEDIGDFESLFVCINDFPPEFKRQIFQRIKPVVGDFIHTQLEPYLDKQRRVALRCSDPFAFMPAHLNAKVFSHLSLHEKMRNAYLSSDFKHGLLASLNNRDCAPPFGIALHLVRAEYLQKPSVCVVNDIIKILYKIQRSRRSGCPRPPTLPEQVILPDGLAHCMVLFIWEIRVYCNLSKIFPGKWFFLTLAVLVFPETKGLRRQVSYNRSRQFC